jgi:hypothetical protein
LVRVLWATTVGNKVVFKKSARKKLCGVVKDEVVVLEKPNEHYRDLIQLIQWNGGIKTVRFCYYVRRDKGKKERWIFSNRSLSIQPRYLRELLKKASEKEWFGKA